MTEKIEKTFGTPEEILKTVEEVKRFLDKSDAPWFFLWRLPDGTFGKFAFTRSDDEKAELCWNLVKSSVTLMEADSEPLDSDLETVYPDSGEVH